jgi:8-oxo-dGTP pyrophosphatase MutT (NUDIX family)
VTDDMSVEQHLQLWADELRAIANEGLHWATENSYDTQRYRHVLRIAAELFARQDTRPIDEIERAYHEDLGHIAPYPVADAAVFDGEGRILLIRRKDNGLWAMPGGALEVGETPAEGACREAWEETGLQVAAVGLIGVYDSRLSKARTPYHLYQLVFLCRPLNAEQQPRVTNETLDVGWYTEQEVAMLTLESGHNRHIPHAFRSLRGESAAAQFDQPTPDLI